MCNTGTPGGVSAFSVEKKTGGLTLLNYKESKGRGPSYVSVDKSGRYYVTSAPGVQIFDPTGRLCGVLERPTLDNAGTSCVLSGANREFLYVTCGDKIFRRKVQAVGNTVTLAPATL